MNPSDFTEECLRIDSMEGLKYDCLNCWFKGCVKSQVYASALVEKEEE
jgi:hypothetical protein